MVRSVTTENSLSRKNSFIARARRMLVATSSTHSAPSRHYDCVVTPNIQSLSRHQALCRDTGRAISVATESSLLRQSTQGGLSRQAVPGTLVRAHARRSFCRVRRHALAPYVATPLQCHDPRLKMGSSPFWPSALQLPYCYYFFCSAYPKTNVN